MPSDQTGARSRLQVYKVQHFFRNLWLFDQNLILFPPFKMDSTITYIPLSIGVRLYSLQPWMPSDQTDAQSRLQVYKMQHLF